MLPRPSITRTCLLAGLLLICPLWACQLKAAEPIEMSYVPETAVLGVLVQSSRILSSPEFESAPLEVLQAAGLEQFGIDPLDVSQVLVVVMIAEVEFEYDGEVMSDMVSLPAAVVRFSKPYSLQDSLAAHQPGWEQEELNGSLMLRQDNWDETCYFMPDDTTLIIGDEDALQEVLGQGTAPASKLVEFLTTAGDEHDAVAVLDLDPVRSMLDGLSEELPSGFPRPLARLTELPPLLSVAQATVNLTGDRASTLDFVANDEAAADEMEEILGEAIGFGQDFVASMLGEFVAETEDPVEQATYAYLQRVSEVAFAAVQPERNGEQLTLTFQPLPGDQAKLVSTLSSALAMGMPAIGAARQAARRNGALNNIRQMGLALANHEAATGRFPSAGGSGEEGHERPGLSWRVHMLPNLEAYSLYQEFHLDEPWDSEHNLTLIERMPAVYMSPGIETEPGYTHYQLVTGEGTAFTGGPGPRMRDFQDGLSNTVVIVEADEPVIWTKPDDWEFNSDNPSQGLGNLRPGNVFLACWADVHSSYINSLADPDALGRAFMYQDGEPFDWSDLEQ